MPRRLCCGCAAILLWNEQMIAFVSHIQRLKREVKIDDQHHGSVDSHSIIRSYGIRAAHSVQQVV